MWLMYYDLTCEHGHHLLVFDAGIAAELVNGHQLVLFFSQVHFNFFHQVSPIALTLASNDLDVLWIYDDSGDHEFGGAGTKVKKLRDALSRLGTFGNVLAQNGPLVLFSDSGE